MGEERRKYSTKLAPVVAFKTTSPAVVFQACIQRACPDVVLKHDDDGHERIDRALLEWSSEGTFDYVLSPRDDSLDNECSKTA